MHQQIEGKATLLAKATIAAALLLGLLLIPSLLRAQELSDLDTPTILKSGTTDVTQASLTVTQTSDPAGHGCCVIAPPNLLEIFLLEGELVFREIGSGNVIPWLDFDPMPVDSNLEFIGQSRATVAGFSNILTVLSGNITQDGIRGTFSIGADGGLPGGQPINYDFLIDAVVGLGITLPRSSFLSIHAQVGVSTSIIEVNPDDEKPESLYLLMEDGLGGTDAEWWLVMLIGGDLFSFDVNTGTFVSGLRPTYTGPTLDIVEPIEFWKFTKPNLDSPFTIFFGIDTILDMLVNEPDLIGQGFTFYF